MLEPHFYEAVQELIDDIHHSAGPANATYRARLDGMLTALHALTGQIWTIESMPYANRDLAFVQNEAGDEIVIPSNV